MEYSSTGNSRQQFELAAGKYTKQTNTVYNNTFCISLLFTNHSLGCKSKRTYWQCPVNIRENGWMENEIFTTCALQKLQKWPPVQSNRKQKFLSYQNQGINFKIKFYYNKQSTGHIPLLHHSGEVANCNQLTIHPCTLPLKPCQSRRWL